MLYYFNYDIDRDVGLFDIVPSAWMVVTRVKPSAPIPFR